MMVVEEAGAEEGARPEMVAAVSGGRQAGRQAAGRAVVPQGGVECMDGGLMAAAAAAAPPAMCCSHTAMAPRWLLLLLPGKEKEEAPHTHRRKPTHSPTRNRRDLDSTHTRAYSGLRSLGLS